MHHAVTVLTGDGLTKLVMASRKSIAKARIDRMLGQFTATCSNKIRCCFERRSPGLHVKMAACLGATRSNFCLVDEVRDLDFARQVET